MYNSALLDIYIYVSQNNNDCLLVATNHMWDTVVMATVKLLLVMVIMTTV